MVGLDDIDRSEFALSRRKQPLDIAFLPFIPWTMIASPPIVSIVLRTATCILVGVVIDDDCCLVSGEPLGWGLVAVSSAVGAIGATVASVSSRVMPSTQVECSQSSP